MDLYSLVWSSRLYPEQAVAVYTAIHMLTADKPLSVEGCRMSAGEVKRHLQRILAGDTKYAVDWIVEQKEDVRQAISELSQIEANFLDAERGMHD